MSLARLLYGGSQWAMLVSLHRAQRFPSAAPGHLAGGL